MSIETVCPGCSRNLQVEASHAGRQVRCPRCSTIYTVPGTPTANSLAPPDQQRPPEPKWYMRTPEGRTFGPVSKSEVDEWVAEGRVTSDCQLRADDPDTWRAADEHYPKLRPQPAVLSIDETAQQTAAPVTFLGNHRPHRAVLILILGVLGCTGCPIFAISAWVMGSSDLTEMRNGRMDTSGMSLTRTGQMLGMVCSMILIVLAVVIVFFLLFVVAGS